MRTLKVNASSSWNYLSDKWMFRIQSHTTLCVNMDLLSPLEKGMVLRKSAHLTYIQDQATTEVFRRLLAHHFKAAIIKKRFQFIQTWISLYQRKKVKYRRQNPNLSCHPIVKSLKYKWHLKMNHFHNSLVGILRNLSKISQGWSIIMRCLLSLLGYLKLKGS